MYDHLAEAGNGIAGTTHIVQFPVSEFRRFDDL